MQVLCQMQLVKAFAIKININAKDAKALRLLRLLRFFFNKFYESVGEP